MKRIQGITLVELMVVLAVLALLGAIVIPLYTQQLQKSRRYDAQGVLLALAAVMEEDLANTPNQGYSITDLTPYSNLWAGIGNHYSFSVVLGGGSFTYTLTASPQGAQSGDACGALTLTNTYAKGAAGGTGCWK